MLHPQERRESETLKCGTARWMRVTLGKKHNTEAWSAIVCRRALEMPVLTERRVIRQPVADLFLGHKSLEFGRFCDTNKLFLIFSRKAGNCSFRNSFVLPDSATAEFY
jgi:hypothetical protein